MTETPVTTPGSPANGHYKALFDNAVVAIFRSKLDGSAIVAANKKLGELFGCTVEELVGNPAIMRWADPAARTEMVRKLRECGELNDYEMDILRKDGELRHCLVSIKLNAKEGYLEGSAIDITDRKRSEEALRESEGRFRQLAESLPQLIWTCRADGPCDYLSPQWVAYTGIPEADQLGYRWLEQLHPDDRERVIAEWSATAPRGTAFDIEFRIRRLDGAHRWFQTRAVPLKDQQGRVIKWFGSNTDVEEIRRSNEALVRSNRELEQFAYVASHDLQEPLRMVSSYTQLLAKRYGDKLDQDAKEFIAYAVDGANRMQRLINDLLQYSRLTTRGKTFEEVDPHAALGEAIANLQTAIGESGALVTNDDLPAVTADPVQLAQLFQNLVSNAVKFRKPAEPPRVHISVRHEGGASVFSVKDNGIGIEPQYFARVFEIFQRLHGKTEYEGTGVGLALCKRIVERHGGKIWVESAPGEGSTFFFSIPDTTRSPQ